MTLVETSNKNILPYVGEKGILIYLTDDQYRFDFTSETKKGKSIPIYALVRNGNPMEDNEVTFETKHSMYKFRKN